MNINDLGAMALSSEFKALDLRGDVHFAKYCQETTGEICVLVSPHEY